MNRQCSFLRLSSPVEVIVLYFVNAMYYLLVTIVVVFSIFKTFSGYKLIIVQSTMYFATKACSAYLTSGSTVKRASYFDTNI